MRIPRLHLDQTLVAGDEMELPAAPARHVKSVLRLRPGATVEVFDGRGNAHRGELLALGRDGARVRLGDPVARDVEPALAVVLGLGISRGERMDFAVQKAVELGVHTLVPLDMEHGVVRLSGERASRRVDHWRSVAVSACEQCGRNRVPDVAPVQGVDRWLGEAPGDALRLMPQPGADRGLADIDAGGVDRVLLLVGPEGGISDAERDLATREGFSEVRLGPRVLRTETAAIAAVAAVMTLWGDLGR